MRRLWLLVAMVGAVGLGVVAWFWRVGSVECRSQYGECREEVRGRLEPYLGSKVWIAKRRMERELAGMSWVKEYSVHYAFADRLIADVVERKAEVALVRERGYLLVSRDGVELGEVEETQLPALRIEDPNITVDEGVMAVGLMYELFGWQGVREGKVRDRGLEVMLRPELKMIFPLSGDIDRALGSANLVLSWLNSGGVGSKISVVDLRYRNPIVK